MFYADWTDALAIAAAALLALALLAPRLARLPPARLDRALGGRVGAALLGAIAAAALPSLVAPGFFGLVRRVYHVGATVFPLIGLLLLGALVCARGGTSRRRAAAAAIAGLGLCALLPLALYMTLVAPYRLTIERARVPLDPARAGGAPLRIAVLADLQTDAVRAWERRVVAQVNALRPDLILLPGDVLQVATAEAYEARLPEVRALLSELRAPYGVFLAPGDVDRSPRRLVEGTGVRLLAGEVVTLAVRDRRVTIGGAPLEPATPAARRVVARLERTPGADDVRILLAHRPDVVFEVRPPGASRIDLVVAGHTHGGQVQLPLFGPLITYSDIPRQAAAGGLHRVAGRRLYVSRGAGMERRQAPRLRLLAPPEVTLLTLE